MANHLKTPIILLFFTCYCYSQSELLNKGGNGLFLFSNYATSADASGLSGGISFSYKGIIDLGIGYGGSWLNEESEHFKLKWNTVQFSMNIIIFRYPSTDTAKFGLGLGISYAYQTYYLRHLYVLEMVSEEFNGNLVLPSIGAYINTNLSNKLDLQYLLSLGYLAGDTKGYVKAPDGSLVFSIGTNLIYKTSSAFMLFLSPSFSFAEDEVTFGVNLGISFITNKN
jgi:hypothetical protein